MKRNKIIEWTFTILVAIILGGSGAIKLIGGEQTVEMAKGVGGASNLFLLGILEMVILVLWFIKRTGVVASLLAISYMAGIIAVMFVQNQSIVMPIVLETIVWVAAVIRFPELGRRLFGTLEANEN